MTSISARELLATDYPEPSYLVPGLVPEGVGLLAGKPKIGKSFLALNLALAVSAGGKALGGIDVERNDVIYLALEDTRRRLKRRLAAALNGGPAPDNLIFESEWQKVDQGGLNALADRISERPATKLVIVDTLERVRPAPRRDRLYADDYAALEPLKSLADKLRIGILVVHHVRKAEALDPLDLVSGSTGLTAAADTVLVLRRERARADAVLYVTGRDVEEQEVALRFDQGLGLWTILGDAEEFRRSKERQEIVDLLRKEGPLTPKEVAEALEKTHGAAKKLLWSMSNEGELSAVDGRYAVTGNPGNPSDSPSPEGTRVTEVTGYPVTEVTDTDRLYFEDEDGER